MSAYCSSCCTLHTYSIGATLNVGPKGCGKTTTAKQKAKSIVEFQDEEQRENLLTVAAVSPSKLLIGDKPRLFDEWQDAPKLWRAVRKSFDDLELVITDTQYGYKREEGVRDI